MPGPDHQGRGLQRRDRAVVEVLGDTGEQAVDQLVDALITDHQASLMAEVNAT